MNGVTQMVTCTRLQLVTADGPGNSVEPSEPKQHGQEKSHGSMTFFTMVAQMAGLPTTMQGLYIWIEGSERVFVCQPRMLTIASLLLSGRT